MLVNKSAFVNRFFFRFNQLCLKTLKLIELVAIKFEKIMTSYAPS